MHKLNAIMGALNRYPEFFDMDDAELADRIDVLWQMRIPDDDSARNVDADIWNELSALELARAVKKGKHK